jgi:uncharacterized protein (UPF0332 family)
MPVPDSDCVTVYLGKASESLAGAESELANGRYNNCANRCYYACFQAAIAALLRAGVEPTGSQWSHEFVQARFSGDLINRRKLFPPTLRRILRDTLVIRHAADYGEGKVGEREAERALRWSRELVQTV